MLKFMYISTRLARDAKRHFESLNLLEVTSLCTKMQD